MENPDEVAAEFVRPPAVVERFELEPRLPTGGQQVREQVLLVGRAEVRVCAGQVRRPLAAGELRDHVTAERLNVAGHASGWQWRPSHPG
jgi:hypothetical protein